MLGIVLRGLLLGMAGVLLGMGCASTAAPQPLRPRPALAFDEISAGDELLRRGLTEEAEEAYRQALVVDDRSIRAHAGLQEIERVRGRHLSLRRKYRAFGEPFLVGRLEGSRIREGAAYARAAEPWKSLGEGHRAWSDSERQDGAESFQRAVLLDPGFVVAQLSLARALLTNGELGAAEAAYRAALWCQPDNPAAAVGLSLIADTRGSLPGALRWARRAYSAAPARLDYANRLRTVAVRTGRKELMAEVAGEFLDVGGDETRAGSTARAVALYHAGDLLRRVDRHEEARAAWSRAVELGITGAEIDALRSGIVPPAVRAFVAAFVAGVNARYRHYAATREAESFDEFVDWAHDLYRRTTGLELDEGRAVIEYAFVGKLVDPTLETGDRLVRALAEQGLLLVLGQRDGGPPEALLASILERRPMAKREVRGVEIEHEVVFTGRRHLSGYQEWAGGGDLAGVALERLLIVDRNAVASWEGRIRRHRARLEPYREEILAEPALEDTPVDSLDDPAGVAERLYLAGGIDLAGEVLAHEEAHLVDAELHLPVGKHALRNLGLAFSRGFSARQILAFLERNAQLTAIAEGPSPLASLANCCERLGGTTVHAKGYSEIVSGFVERIRRDPGRFPSIDAERVIVQQLHRLSVDEIRSLARELMDDWNLTR